jgi:hypothetical protein
MTGRADAPWSPDPDAEGLKARFGENVRLLRARGPQFFSAARGEFEISPRSLIDLGADRFEPDVDR